jgi:hypothetical protein
VLDVVHARLPGKFSGCSVFSYPRWFDQLTQLSMVSSEGGADPAE